MLNPPEVLNARILIVDDEPANVQLLERVLAEAGYTDVVSTLSSGDVETLHGDSPFDLILLDLQMPGMDGFEVMERLGTVSTETYLPVIVLTAQPGHKLRALQAGARDFISKPFDLVEVKTRIHNMLEVRLLHKELARYNVVLEQTVLERTAALRESEERYRRLTQLASDWHWVQDEQGRLIDLSGPAMEMLGLPLDVMSGLTRSGSATGWDEAQRGALRTIIDARQPFLDFVLSRDDGLGGRQFFRISGEPIFDVSCRFIGYRGVGVEFLDDVRAPTVSD
jgi:DNA-binding response OmpR family regulator